MSSIDVMYRTGALGGLPSAGTAAQDRSRPRCARALMDRMAPLLGCASMPPSPTFCLHCRDSACSSGLPLARLPAYHWIEAARCTFHAIRDWMHHPVLRENPTANMFARSPVSPMATRSSRPIIGRWYCPLLMT